MAQIRSSRWWLGLTAVLAFVFLGSVFALTFRGWGGGSPDDGTGPTTGSTPSATASLGPQEHPVPLRALPLGESTLSSIGPGWLLVEYDSGSGTFTPAGTEPVNPAPEPSASDAEATVLPESPDSTSSGGTWETPGPRYLYLVDPSGELYEAADLGEDSDLRLLAWLPDRRTAIVGRLDPLIPGRMTLHRLDLITGSVSDPLAGPEGSFTEPEWDNPRVSVSVEQDALLVEYGADRRGLIAMGIDGVRIGTIVPPSEGLSFIEGSGGGLYVVGETSGSGANAERTIAIYTRSDLVEPSGPVPELSPSASAATTPVTPGTYVRVDHGLPAAEDNCSPGTWPDERQLVIVCPQDANTFALYTLAPATSTFVEVSTVRRTRSDTFFVFNPDDGTRIALGREVAKVIGTTAWSMSRDDPAPLGLTWAGNILVAWGDASLNSAAGYGAANLRSYQIGDGSPLYVVYAVPGASGFHAVVAAP